MTDEPLAEEQRDGALGAIVAALAATGDEELTNLAEVLRRGGDLTATWDDENRVIVNLAIPPGHPLRDLDQLEDRVFEIVSRAIATCGLYVQRVRLTLALAKSGWRLMSKEEFPLLLAGRFEREADPLKRGGFGVVYKARDLSTNSDIALKVLRLPQNEGPKVHEQHYLRFRREMQLMSQLSHPNLMDVLWFGEEDSGILWYAMPLAEGSLGDRLSEFPSDSNRILAVLASICDGVAYLHQEGVVHRDLSPGNVLCMPDGSWVISDLGLAFDLDRELTQLTTTGMSMGTIGYRPPDVEVQMAKSASSSWDIYSLGQLLADMTNGRPYSERNGALTDSVFRPAIIRACQSDPARRFPSVREFLDECRKLVELSTSWEGPDERRTRILDALRNADTSAVHELAVNVEAGGGIEPFVSALCDISHGEIAQLATSSAEDLRTLTLIFLDEMPGQWPQFSQLDGMAAFLIASAEALQDDFVSERTLTWVLEIGTAWNRWNVQNQAHAYLRRLASVSLDVVTRSLRTTAPEAIPDDLSWLHPAARPPQTIDVDLDNSDDEAF